MRQSPSRPYVRPILSPGREKKGGFGAPPVILHTNSVSIACARAVNPSKLRIQHTGGGGQAEPAMMALRRPALVGVGQGSCAPPTSSVGGCACCAGRAGSKFALALMLSIFAQLITLTDWSEQTPRNTECSEACAAI